MEQKDGVFYFDFYDDSTDSEESVAFAFTIDKSVAQKVADGIEEDWYQDIFYELEGEYGVHDWSSSPVNGVPAIGYTTYEVEPSKQEELVVKWRNAIADEVGSENVSSVVKIGAIDYQMDDLAILNKTKAVVEALVLFKMAKSSVKPK